jgi:hypothetical protein
VGGLVGDDPWTAVHHHILGSDDEFTANNGDDVPIFAPDCLGILREKCGTESLNQTVKHKLHLSGSNAINVYSPLALPIAIGNWVLFRALRDLHACFETNVSLNQLFSKPFYALQSDVVDFLVDHGLQFTSQENWMQEIFWQQFRKLTLEEAKSLVAILKILVPRGLNIDKTDRNGQTILHVVAGSIGSAELTAELLELGANPYKKNNSNFDVFLVAALQQRFDVLRCILGYTKEHTRDQHENHWSQHLDDAKIINDSETLHHMCMAMKSAGNLDDKYKSDPLLCTAARSAMPDSYRRSSMLV